MCPRTWGSSGGPAGVVFSWLILLFAYHTLPGQSVTEHQVKAAYLYNFAKFIQWPAGAFANAESPLYLCVAGEDLLGQPLDIVTKGKVINGHMVAVRRITFHDDMKICHIVFLGSSDRKRLLDVLRRLNGSNVLAVGDNYDFATMGGSIQFYRDNDTIRFCINVDALQRSGLTASSKLLALAKVVHDEASQNGE